TGLAAVSLVADPTFTWQSIAGADRYQIQVERVLVGGGTTVVFDVNNVALTSYQHNVDLLEGNYTVRVRALDQVPGQTIASKWSTVRNFTVDVNQSPTTEAFVPTITNLLESNGSALTTRQELGRFDVVDDLDGTILVTVNSTAGTPAFFESQPTLISTVVNGNERRLTYAVYLKAGENINRDAPDLLTSLSATIDINDNDPLLPATPDASLGLTVTIDDRNDSAPVLNGTPAIQAHLPEDAELGDEFGSVSGVDADTGANYTYTWQIGGAITGSDGQVYSDLFELIGNAPNLTTGAISARIRVAQNAAFDFDSPTAPKSFVLHNVTVNDGVATSNPVDVTVVLDDVNDNAPVVPEPAIIDIAENASIGSQHGAIVATDVDTVGSYVWTLRNTDGSAYTGLFSIVGIGDGRTAKISVNGVLDYETQPTSYTLQAVLTNGTFVVSRNFSIHLVDVNDTVPVIIQPNPTLSISEDAANDAFVGNLFVFDPDTNDMHGGWTIVGNTGIFKIDANTGTIRVDDNTELDYESTPGHQYTLKIQMTDGFNPSAVTDIVINVINVVEPPKISVRVEGTTDLIPDNTGSESFGSFGLNSVVKKTFKVINHGDTALIVNGVVYTATTGPANGFIVAPNFTNGQSIPPGAYETFVVTMNTAVDGDLAGTLSFATNDPDANPFNFEITGKVLPAVPELLVGYAPNADELNVGATHNFGSAQQGGTVPVVLQQTFFVTNTGTGVLKLKQPSLTVNAPPRDSLKPVFAVTTNWAFDSNGDFNLAVGDSASFVVTYTPANYVVDVDQPTVVSGEITLNSDDTDENPFLLNLTAVVQPAGDVLYLDDDTYTYSPGTGALLEADRSKSGTGYLNTFDRIQGDSYGEWSTTLSEPGLYRISAAWPTRDEQKNAGHPTSLKISNAVYSVSLAGSARANVKVNQFGSANDRQDKGVWWEDLGVFSASTSGQSLNIRLNSSAGAGTVIADAIRIERVDVLPDLVTLPAGRIEHRIDVTANDPALQLNAFNADYHAASDWTVTNLSTVGNGTLSVDSDGAIRFRPTNPYVASSGSFTYTLSSASLGIQTRPTTVSLSVAQGLTILPRRSVRSIHSRPLTFDVTSSDFDPLAFIHWSSPTVVC
ncbi:MAG: cadherin domain-containing protein, partial [Planctomycetaceae bacterium]